MVRGATRGLPQEARQDTPVKTITLLAGLVVLTTVSGIIGYGIRTVIRAIDNRDKPLSDDE